MKPEGLSVSFSVSFLLVQASPVAVLPGVDLPGSVARGHRGADQSRQSLALVERTDPIALVEAHRLRSKLQEYY
jgi:hypothetical protein